MNKLIAASVAGALLAVAGAAQADSDYQEMRPYVSGAFSYVFEKDRRDFDVDASQAGKEDTTGAGEGFQLGAGKAINRYLGVELSAFNRNYDHNLRGSPSFREYGAKLDGLFFYDRDPKFSPYFGLGFGGIRTDIKNSNQESTDPFADVGVGFMKFFDVSGTELGIRGDVRYRRIFFSDDAFGQTGVDDLGETVLNVGLVIPLGAKPAPAAAKPAACADTDGDGVCDTSDLCPETPKGTVVDAKGCPADKKSDKSDPNQKFEDVYFPFDKSELTEYAKGILDNAAKVIGGLSEKYPSLKVDISGHTDWIGTDGYNQGLSERRANTVKQYLVRKGVDAGRINTYAYGEARPKATNETDEGRALNRRAEVRTRDK